MSKSFFDKLYTASAELLKNMNQPLVKKSLKRKFESGRDKAIQAHLDAIEGLNKEREKINKDIEDYDINKIVELRQTAEDAKNTVKYIADEYSVMFGEELADTELEDLYGDEEVETEK